MKQCSYCEQFKPDDEAGNEVLSEDGDLEWICDKCGEDTNEGFVVDEIEDDEDFE